MRLPSSSPTRQHRPFVHPYSSRPPSFRHTPSCRDTLAPSTGSLQRITEQPDRDNYLIVSLDSARDTWKRSRAGHFISSANRGNAALATRLSRISAQPLPSPPTSRRARRGVQWVPFYRKEGPPSRSATHRVGTVRSLRASPAGGGAGTRVSQAADRATPRALPTARRRRSRGPAHSSCIPDWCGAAGYAPQP